MPTETLISVEEYLATSYDYIDGLVLRTENPTLELPLAEVFVS